jgi:chemotaxis response regulator CheB
VTPSDAALAVTDSTRKRWFVVIAASAGGLPALQTVLAAFPADLPAAVVIVQHRSPLKHSLLETILARIRQQRCWQHAAVRYPHRCG